ncbi:MAG: hypothetical protein LBC17_01485 [Lactobacillaceae bacterium]|jgi:hypothetical protein|nr:hypothetical protein [Lactobacillaceae bacterium]
MKYNFQFLNEDLELKKFRKPIADLIKLQENHLDDLFAIQARKIAENIIKLIVQKEKLSISKQKPVFIDYINLLNNFYIKQRYIPKNNQGQNIVNIFRSIKNIGNTAAHDIKERKINSHKIMSDIYFLLKFVFFSYFKKQKRKNIINLSTIAILFLVVLFLLTINFLFK